MYLISISFLTSFIKNLSKVDTGRGYKVKRKQKNCFLCKIPKKNLRILKSKKGTQITRMKKGDLH